MYYSFTFRKVSHPVWIQDYEDHLNKLRDKYPEVKWDYMYEDGPESGLHIHGIAQTNKSMHVRQIHPGHGWSVDWSQTRNVLVWIKYCLKHHSKQTDLINEQYRLYYEFLDSQQKPLPENPEDSEEYIEILDAVKFFGRGLDIDLL